MFCAKIYSNQFINAYGVSACGLYMIIAWGGGLPHSCRRAAQFRAQCDTRENVCVSSLRCLDLAFVDICTT
jgi:hypothetical protein